MRPSWYSVRSILGVLFVFGLSISAFSGSNLFNIPNLLGVGLANAQNISSIQVRGNKRISDSVILSNILLKPGQKYSKDLVNASLRKLYATGIFNNVKISRSGNIIYINVIENSVVSQVAFEGNSAISSEKLKNILNVKPGNVLIKSAMAQDKKIIVSIYRNTGRFSTVVQSKLYKLSNGTVRVTYKITEGSKVRIKAFSVSGNSYFGARRLERVMTANSLGVIDWLFGGPLYRVELLQEYQNNLYKYYLNEGFADFRVDSIDASYDGKKEGFVVKVKIYEGRKYKIGSVRVNSYYKNLAEKNLLDVVLVKHGDTYSIDKIRKDNDAIHNYAVTHGYGFALSSSIAEKDPVKGEVNLRYILGIGPKTYVERIEITGNIRTKDYVIRRELEINEGDVFRSSLIEKAKRRITFLDFFTSIDISIKPGSSKDRIIVVVKVVEKGTGQFGFKGGYDSITGLLGSLYFNEKNLLGKGQYINATVGAGKSGYKNFSFSFLQPRFFGSRVSAGFELFYNQSGQTDYQSYKSKKFGGVLKASLPLIDNMSLALRYKLYKQSTSIYDTENVSTLGYSLLWRTINDPLFPTKGVSLDLSQDFAGLGGGDVNYVKTTAYAKLYFDLIPSYDIVAHFHGQLGYVNAWGSKGFSMVESFFNGFNLVRGFSINGIGAKDKDNTRELGSTFYYGTSAELRFPIWLLPSSFNIRGVVFADLGSSYNTQDSSKLAKLASKGNVLNSKGIRSSLGVGVIWLSPFFGPISLNVAWPLSQEEGDKTKKFSFSVYSAF